MIVMKFSGFDVLAWDDDDPLHKIKLSDPKTVDAARQVAERFREEADKMPAISDRISGGEDG